MRIAFDYQAFTLQAYGGISRYFSRLAMGLIECKQTVNIIAPIHRNRYILSFASEHVQGIYFDNFKPKLYGLINIYNKSISSQLLKKWKPTVLHKTYYSGYPLCDSKCAIVVTVYDMIHELFPQYFVNNKTRLEKKISVERADRVICISNNTKQDLVNIYDIDPKKVSVVHLGVDTLFPCYVKDDLYINRDSPYLLYVGERHGYKNFENMISAIGSSNSLKRDFSIIAFGGPEFSKGEVDLIHNQTSLKVYHVSGNDELLASYYSFASAFIYPSIYEGFGIPPLEAMANGCPVVSSNTSSMTEVLGSACEYFNPRDIDSIKSAIKKVVYSSERTAILKVEGKKRAMQFSWDKCVKDTLRIYESCND